MLKPARVFPITTIPQPTITRLHMHIHTKSWGGGGRRVGEGIFLLLTRDLPVLCSFPTPMAFWANLSLAFRAFARSFFSFSSSDNMATSCFAFSRTFIPWSLLSASMYWKLVKVLIAWKFSLHCCATWNIMTWHYWNCGDTAINHQKTYRRRRIQKKTFHLIQQGWDKNVSSCL